MICDVYGCDDDYWVNLAIREGISQPDSVDVRFDNWRFNLGLSIVASLTANQLKGK